jgi:hypothetical protein
MTAPISPSIGDSVYLGDIPFIAHCFGVISDLDTPDQVSASLEIFGSNGALSLSALMGPQGPMGTSAPVGKLQFIVFDDEDDLPTNLTDDDVDVGKYWIVRKFDDDENEIGSNWYIWYGDHYERFMMGTAGPVGPVPVVAFSVELLDPDDDDLENEVVQTGDQYHPSLLFKIKAPKGPVGPAGPIRDSEDYDDTVAPVSGDVIAWNGTKYAPVTATAVRDKFYTMPEASFVDVPLAIGTSVPLGSFLVPPQAFDCVPYVQGHMRITGLEADTDPFIIGAEVRLGSAVSGAVVSRGFGNISTYVNLIPHASTTSTPNDAITPDNGRAVIPAGATGAAATLYVNAFNDGVTGVYHFEKRGAQLSILLVPV